MKFNKAISITAGYLKRDSYRPEMFAYDIKVRLRENNCGSVYSMFSKRLLAGCMQFFRFILSTFYIHTSTVKSAHPERTKGNK